MEVPHTYSLRKIKMGAPVSLSSSQSVRCRHGLWSRKHPRLPYRPSPRPSSGCWAAQGTARFPPRRCSRCPWSPPPPLRPPPPRLRPSFAYCLPVFFSPFPASLLPLLHNPSSRCSVQLVPLLSSKNLAYGTKKTADDTNTSTNSSSSWLPPAPGCQPPDYY